MHCGVICLAASRATTVKRSKSRTVGSAADAPPTEVAPTEATLTLTLASTNLVPAIATFALHRVARPPGQVFAGSGLRQLHAQQPQHVAVESPPLLGCSTKILRALRAHARPSQEHILSGDGLHFGC